MISSLLKPTVVVNGKKYKIISQIGEGGFAFVYSVRSINKEDKNENYALKKMICQLDEQMSEAKKEIDLMLKVKHTNVIPLIDFSYLLNKKGQSEVYLLLPLYVGSVQSVIDKGHGFPHCSFTDGLDVVQILRQTLEGLIAVHSCGFRHADLKPANILLTADYQAVLTDFGSASPLVEEVTNRAEALTIQDKAAVFTTASYRAPELHSTPSLCTIDGKTDVWSFGCCMYNIFYSRTPFESAVEGLSVLAIMSGHYSIPEGNMWPADYLEIVEKCLQPDPAQRLSVDDLHLRLRRVTGPPLDLTPVIRPLSTPRGPSSASTTPRRPSSSTIPQTEAEGSASPVTTNITSPSMSSGSQRAANDTTYLSTSHVPPVQLVQHGRAASLNANNFADFASEEAVQVHLEEQDSAAEGNEALPMRGELDRQASRDVFGDKIRKDTAIGGVAQSVAPFADSLEEGEEQEEEEFFSASAEVNHGEALAAVGLSLQSPSTEASQDSFAHAISRSQFTDSCSTNDTSYVNAFDSQDTFTTYGNGSPVTTLGCRVQRVPSHGSYGEFVFMEHGTVKGTVSTPGGGAGAGSQSTPRQSINFSSSAISDDAWLIKEAIAASEQEQQRHGEGESREGDSASASKSPAALSEPNDKQGGAEDFEEVDAFGDFADGSEATDPFQVVTAPSTPSSSLQQQQQQQEKPHPDFFATFPTLEESLSEGCVTSPVSNGSSAKLQKDSSTKPTIVVPAVAPLKGTLVGQQKEAEEAEAVEAVDLYKVILAQSVSSSVGDSGSSSSNISSGGGGLKMVLKEGPVNILRMTGFPKRLAKKQVWLVLTASGLVLRKDASRDSKVHDVVSLHRPLYLTSTDTMSIGLHGLLLQGFSPRSLPSGAHHSQSSNSVGSTGGSGEEDWVSVTLADLTVEQSAVKGPVASNARIFKSLFNELRCEVSFSSKDCMNDWIDAIEAQREVCCNADGGTR